MSPLDRLSRGLNGLIFPKLCPGCEDLLPSDALPDRFCDDCAQDLRRIEPPCCDVCGQAYSGALFGPFECSNCADLYLRFDAAISSYRSTGIAREMVHQLKYLRRLHLVPLLSNLLAETLEDERILDEEDWVLVPVPLHRKRQRWRRFNQAERLCLGLKRFEGQCAFPMVPALQRVRDTKQQVHLDRTLRLENLRDAFALSKRARHREAILGKNVLLVDDVLTTGTTASECAAVLKDEGKVAKVVVITALRG